MGLFGGDKKKPSRGGSDRRSTDSAGQRKSRRIVVPGGVGDKDKAKQPTNRQRSGSKPQTKKTAPAAPAKPVDSAIEQLPPPKKAPASPPPAVEPSAFDELDPIESSDDFGLEELPTAAEVSAAEATATTSHSGPVCRTGDQPLLDLLIKTETITNEQAQGVQGEAEASGQPIDITLAQQGILDEEKLVGILTTECWLPHLRVEKYDIKKKALDVLTREKALYYGVLPIDKLGNILNLAMINVLDEESARDIENETGLDIKKIVSTRSEIEAGIEKYYGSGAEAVADNGPREFVQDHQSARVTKMLAQANAMSEESLPPEEVPAEADPLAVEDDPFAAADEAAEPPLVDSLEVGEAVAPVTLDLDEIEPDEPVAPEPIELTEFEVEEAPAPEPAATPEPTPASEAPSFDLEDGDDIFADPTPAAAEAAPAIPEPAEPIAAISEPEPTPAPAPAPVAAEVDSSVVDLIDVTEEDFQHAIASGKQRVFEKWLSLQTRNRILNALPVENELNDVLSPVMTEPETVAI